MDCFTAFKCELLIFYNPIKLTGNHFLLLVTGVRDVASPPIHVVFHSEPDSLKEPLGGATIKLVSLIRVAGFLICRQFIFIQTKGDHVKNITSVDSL